MWKAAIFSLINHLHQSRRNITYFPSILYLSNLAIHLLLFLSLPLINRLHLQTIITSITLIVLLSIFTLLMVLQMVFYLVKKRELYLAHQLMLFRFILVPLLTLSLLQTASTK